ncbi:MAG: hypothetical protein ACM3SY_18150 [Candidatus Omnitrophota bacterium]
MNMQEIADTLINGFHDANVNEINLNFLKKTAQINLDIWLGDETEPERYQKGRLFFSDFLFLSIDPPDEGVYSDTFVIDLVENDNDILDNYESFKKLKEYIPDGYLITCFSLLNHITMMYLIYKDVKFEWV